MKQNKTKFNRSTLLPWSKFCFVSLYKPLYASEAIKTENKFAKDKTDKMSYKAMSHMYVNSTQTRI